MARLAAWMGLDETAAHFVWFVALAFVASSVTGVWTSHAEDLLEATAAREARDAERVAERLRDASACHDAGAQTLTVEAVNAGRFVLDLSSVVLLVDGAVLASLSREAGPSASTATWQPAERAWFNATGVVSPPSAVALVTGRGLVVAVEALECPELTSIVVTPSSVAVLTGASQAFTATAYDQYGEPMDGIVFSWSATRGSVDAGGVYTAPSTTGADTVTASSGAVSGDAAVSVEREVHVDAIGTYLAGVPTSTFQKKDTVETRVTMRDHDGALAVGVLVTVEFVRPDMSVASSGSAVTDASGVASVSHVLSASAQQGTWTTRVTDASATDTTYDSASNVVTELNFTVVP